MMHKTIFVGFMALSSLLVVGCGPAKHTLAIHSQTAMNIELIGYNGLNDNSLFKGDISAGGKHEIATPYRGLALLSFAGGQRYPVIIGDDFFTLKIKNVAELPSFVESGENDAFYKLLSGEEPDPEQYSFALLMIQAKQLLESSHSIHTVKELTAKKKEFHDFVSDHYARLKHSDMVRRLIGQYFMMHEYVDYHIEGAPATDIRLQYQKTIVNGVESWLEILKPYMPDHEILNYCVSLYYNRSMVTLSSFIVDNFRSSAYCPGDEKETFNFPANLALVQADGNSGREWHDLKHNKIIAFVSDNCPVSMVETVIKARQLSQGKKNVLIVAPLQQLSEKHLAMSKMVSNGNMYFVNDEQWRKNNLEKKIKLPSFIQIEDDFPLGTGH